MRICVIPGDGIGHEVVGAALRVLRAVLPAVEIVEAAAGWGVFQVTGVALPAAALEAARASDAVFFGAVASPSHPVPGYRSPIVALRRELDLYANIRPTSYELRAASDEQNTPHSQLGTRRSSLVVVRENTEDLYAGRERSEDDGNTAIAERVITRRASERIVQAAFELARRRATRDDGPLTVDDRPSSIVHRPQVTVVHKANVLRVTDGLFRTVALEVAQQYPDVEVEELLVDTAAMHLARSPERFDVIVTTNMFGDILSDIACIHGGGLGLASSANIGERYALFEPVHGAAPDIAGKGIANPLAAIGCVAMLLEWAGSKQADVAAQQAAARVHAAIAAVLRAGPHTPDLGGSATTVEVAEAVVAHLAA